MCQNTNGSHRRTITRRRLVLAGLTATTVSVAGCSGDGDPTATTTETDEATGTETPGETPTDTTTEMDRSNPVDPVPEGSRCAVCEMEAAKYPDWNAQLTHENGDRPYFCSPGCLTAYYAVPSHFDDGHSRDDVAAAWVRDYDSTEYVDAFEAQYVLEETESHIDAPMGDNPVPFADAAAAQEYVAAYDDKTGHDIVPLSSFDVALATRFRSRFLPDVDETAITQPVDVPEDASCGVCEMMPAKFPDWNAQLSHEDGERTFFCSPGCLTAYHADPGHFDEGRGRDGVVGVWTHCVASKELVDGRFAHYVLEPNGERNEGPMMTNPRPYGRREDAIAYVDEYEDRTREDVVSLSAFDVALAAEFRGKHFPDVDETAITRPVDVPEDASCGVCEMMPAKFPDWNAQLSHEDGERTFFCSPGCMVAYYSDPGTFTEGQTQADVVGVWAHDVASTDLVDGTLAHYVLDTSGERNEGPMMANPRPYAEESDALAYVDEYDDLTDDDVIRLQEITRDHGVTYRQKQF